MVAMLVALDIVITRFIAIQTPITRIGFGFLATSMCSMLFGPFVGAGAAFMGDFLGLGTLWTSMLTTKAPLALLFTRIPQSLLMAPIKIIMIKLSWEYVGKYIENKVSYALHG